jgi:hypothetical protein
MLDNKPMTNTEALDWLTQVDGTVFHNKHQTERDNAWVAVVRTPDVNGLSGKIILAFGDSLEVAASVAEKEWRLMWDKISRVH